MQYKCVDGSHCAAGVFTSRVFDSHCTFLGTGMSFGGFARLCCRNACASNLRLFAARSQEKSISLTIGFGLITGARAASTSLDTFRCWISAVEDHIPSFMRGFHDFALQVIKAQCRFLRRPALLLAIAPQCRSKSKSGACQQMTLKYCKRNAEKHETCLRRTVACRSCMACKVPAPTINGIVLRKACVDHTCGPELKSEAPNLDSQCARGREPHLDAHMLCCGLSHRNQGPLDVLYLVSE